MSNSLVDSGHAHHATDGDIGHLYRRWNRCRVVVGMSSSTLVALPASLLLHLVELGAVPVIDLEAKRPKSTATHSVVRGVCVH